MEVDEENPSSMAAVGDVEMRANLDASNSVTDSVTATATLPMLIASSVAPPPLVMPSGVVFPLAPPPTVAPLVVPPPIAPLPIVPSLAPLPVCPPVLKPPVDVKANDSESDEDNQGSEEGAGYEITEESRQVREKQEKLMREFMMKRRAAALAVPTNDMAVRTRLRRLGEPITLFGEKEMERRDRLRMLMAKLDAEGQLEKLMKALEEEGGAGMGKEDFEEETLQYPFYTEGSNELLEARKFIARFSISRASWRLQRAKRKRDDPDEDEDAEIDWALNQSASFALDVSEIGDDRPLSGCSFSKDGNLLATWYV